MTEYEAIEKRMAIRRFAPRPLLLEDVEKIERRFLDLPRPFSSGRLRILVRNRDDLKGKLRSVSVDAPAYILFLTEPDGMDLEQVGYAGERLALYLVGLGIGSCWMGSATAKKGAFPDGFAIALAVGYLPDGASFRTLDQPAKRKALEQYCLNEPPHAMRRVVEAVRMAPTGMNLQPVACRTQEEGIHLFRKKPVIPFKLDSMQRIDSGIALAHAELAVEHQFGAAKIGSTTLPKEKGWIYVSSVWKSAGQSRR